VRGRSDESVVALKRRFYFVFLSVLAGACFVLWLVATEPARLTTHVLGVSALASLVGLLFLWKQPEKVSVIERGIYWLAYPILLGSLYLNLEAAGTTAARFEALQSFNSWPKALAVWSFLAFGARRGLVAGLGFVGATVVVIAIQVAGGPPIALSGARYLVQSVASGTLFGVLLYASATIMERQSVARSRAEAEARFSMFDVLTGLPNRRMLEERFEFSKAVVDRSGESLAICFIDVDDFKRINDTFGHAGGDEMLRQFAQRLSRATRPTDLVARVGGDEFVVLAIVADQDHARSLAGRIVEVFASPFEIDGQPVSMHPSVGVSIYPDDGVAIDALLSRADAAMYQVKADGKNSWRAASRHQTTVATAPPS
jgi:diguanylate cyclase (GGDEF)-like protein